MKSVHKLSILVNSKKYSGVQNYRITKLKFIALDVETANADMASICQIGIAKYAAGQLVDEWSVLVDPEDYFDHFNIAIHGITEEKVAGCPTFPKIVDELGGLMNNEVCVCHTHFDRVSIKQALSKYALPEFDDVVWLDSARVVRRTWTEFAWRGYGLDNVCKFLGYEFKHHDALEDAKAAGAILIAASKESGLDIAAWLKRVEQPIDPIKASRGAKRDGNPEGALYGEIMVFTGKLDMPRHEAADMASKIGCQVTASLSTKTTMLVVGDQDVTRLAGHEKSSKHRKAEQIISGGFPIRILKETDFKELVALS